MWKRYENEDNKKDSPLWRAFCPIKSKKFKNINLIPLLRFFQKWGF